jgi:hypothetical protein
MSDAITMRPADAAMDRELVTARLLTFHEIVHMQSPKIGVNDLAVVSLEHVGELRSPDHLVVAVGCARVNGRRERIVDA